MYFKNYNPTLHDVYLYGAGNTGYPIALNPNCLIYGASASYQAISLRYRDWTVVGNCGPPPTGSSLGVYPNYYNIGYPLFWWVSKTMLGACTHFSSDKPCDTTLSFPFVKETGLTAQYGRYYWDSNLSTKTYYDNFRGIYNCVSYEPDVDIPRYFEGWSGASLACEDQAPGYGTGATYYQITTTDHSFSRLPSASSPNIYTGKVLKAISPLGVLTQQQISGLTQYLVEANSTNEFDLGNIIYEFPVNDVYFWGGNDTVQSVSKLRLGYRQLDILPGSFWPTPSLVYKRGPFIKMIFDEGEESILWSGDSSGLLLYMKNGELFSLMSLLTTQGIGDLHSSTVLPNMQYMLSQTDIKSTYFYSNRGTGTAANKAGFSAAYLAMANALIVAQNKYNQLTTLPIAPTGFTASEALGSGVTFTWTDLSNNELGYKIFYHTPEIIDGDVIDVDSNQMNQTGFLLSWGYSGDSDTLTGFEILRANSPLAGLTVVPNDVRGYIDEGLTQGITYTYAIRGYRGFNTTVLSSTVSKRVNDFPGLVEPAIPENFTALSISDSTINLSWTKGTDIFAGEPDGYIIYRGLCGAGPYRIVAETTGATNYSLTRLNDDTKYFFKIEAYNSGGPSGLTGTPNATTFPPTPNGFSGIGGSTTQINLYWSGYTFSSPINSFYNIYRSFDNTTFLLAATASATATGYTNSGLSYGQNYWYKINAQNAGGTSVFSSTINLTPVVFPSIPTGFTTNSIGITGATFQWTDNANNEVGFKIFYS